MPIHEKLNGLVSVYSNSPGMPTGYGEQMRLLIDRLVRHGLDTAILSNYGNEGQIAEYKTPYGKIPHYPRSFVPHSVDTLNLWHDHHRAGKDHLPQALFTLYDVWVLGQVPLPKNTLCWVPIDHITMPGMVRAVLERPEVHPITMAPHGKRVLDARGIENTYIPHSIDTAIFKPASATAVKKIRNQLGVADDVFLVTMVAANKANGNIHRKALAENVMAFASFHKQYPKSKLYMHTESRPLLGGIDLASLFESLGLGKDDVVTADGNELMIGLPQATLRDIYSASDVLLAASYGEGFGVPVIEAQACGTPVITSNATATKDLAGESSYLVNGQLFWDMTQNAYLQIPSVTEIYSALVELYNKWDGNGTDDVSVAFAKQFDVEVVWRDYWMPLLKRYFA
jgi:glycosyltransferase involved in cell wall biosynthesis